MIQVQLKPLAQKALSSQLYHITGDYFTSGDYTREEETITHNKSGIIFKFAPQKDEKIYKLHTKINERGEEERKRNKYNHIKHPFIDYNNSDRWRNGLKALEGPGQPIIEMDMEAYYNFLECVPPKAMDTKSYVCGEPHHHNNQGQGVYLCGIERNNKFYAQYGTVTQYRNRELFKGIQ